MGKVESEIGVVCETQAKVSGIFQRPELCKVVRESRLSLDSRE